MSRRKTSEKNLTEKGEPKNVRESWKKMWNGTSSKWSWSSTRKDGRTRMAGSRKAEQRKANIGNSAEDVELPLRQRRSQNARETEKD